MALKRLPKTEFAAAVAQIAGERNIDAKSIIESIEMGIISAYKRDQKERGIEVSEEAEFVVDLSAETGSFKVFEVKEDGSQVDVTPPGFGRIAAQTARQVIDQKIREIEKESIVSDYRKKLGTIVVGTVLRIDPAKTTVGVGRAEAIMPRNEQVKNETLIPGTKKLFLLKDITEDEETGRSDIILSRADPEFISQLFAREVPEVGNKSVVIKKIARSPGERTKVAVASTQPGIDPVGSCIGQKGSRIQSILNELPTDEKVDVVPFSENTEHFIVQALSPAQDVKVTAIEDNLAQVSVPENQLALAIGAGGDNVRLAGQLVGLEIKVTEREAAGEE